MTLPLLIISGPTASGKTAMSLKAASRFSNIEIINFDSLLFYKELNIGTAKPTQDEMSACPHHLIDICSAKDPLNAADYEKLALRVVEDIHSRGAIPLLTGGSGFYLQALLYGMFESKNVDEGTRLRSEKLYKDEGIAPFLEILRSEDPKSFERYHENDHYRVRRAVEHFWTTGSKFSEKRKEMMGQREENSHIKTHGWDVFHAYLDPPKPVHFEIIQNRTKKMMDDGLIQEVQSLIERGFTGKEKPLQSIGYKETFQYLRKELTLSETIERINISTRQLAKAQRTWFKKVDKNEYDPLKDQDQVLTDMKNFLNI